MSRAESTPQGGCGGGGDEDACLTDSPAAGHIVCVCVRGAVGGRDLQESRTAPSMKPSLLTNCIHDSLLIRNFSFSQPLFKCFGGFLKGYYCNFRLRLYWYIRGPKYKKVGKDVQVISSH